ncbi:SHC-transforming protein 4-like [Rhinatrema bivittatum]|uniref:SHC-transforming protein 4-like n=1 Tax=Rhinatrema bivittatum TaxID=194408 RepID=UPI00112BA062|nr:SHC-transforming protein 4-like [Rhinatrema bivittatum]
MRERTPHSLSEHKLYVGLFRPPGMLHRAKYSRFRNDSVTSLEEGTQGTPLNIKGSLTRPDFPLEDAPLSTEDSSSALCTLLPKMANIKLSNPAGLLSLRHFSLGTKEGARVKLTERSASPPPEISCASSVSAAPEARVEPAAERARPPREDSACASRRDVRPPLPAAAARALEAGLTYHVRYMGCIEVLESMRSLDFGTRTQVTREAISRLCEAVPGARGAIKRRKPPVKFLSLVLGKSNLQFSGMSIRLTVSTSSLTLSNADTQQIIAHHHMQSISFASGGDPDTTDYVAYVAKDPVNQRACHIVECPNDMAQDVINTIGQAFEVRLKQYLKSPSSLTAFSESEEKTLEDSAWHSEVKEEHEYYNELPGKEPPSGGLLDMRLKVHTTEQRPTCLVQNQKQYCLTDNPTCTNIYENCLERKTIGNSGEQSPKTKEDITLLTSKCRSDLFDDPCYMNTQTLPDKVCPKSAVVAQIYGSPQHHTKLPEAVQQVTTSNNSASMCGPPQITQQLRQEDWYHGRLSRKAAERLLVNDGDFLVRESATSLCQYVLSGLQGGQAKHLLLVDPEGKVRTRDHVFDSVHHLICYHVENKLPIISFGSELCLKQPVRKNCNTAHRK